MTLPDELPECLIVDLQMPEMTGLELQHHLNRAGIRIPTIVITANRASGNARTMQGRRCGDLPLEAVGGHHPARCNQ